jgi:iron complex outermembrane receptor protein
MGGTSQKLTVALWGRNIFNEQYIFRRDPSNSLPGAPTSSLSNGPIGNVLGDYGNFNAPRTYGIEATVSF